MLLPFASFLESEQASTVEESGLEVSSIMLPIWFSRVLREGKIVGGVYIVNINSKIVNISWPVL